MGMMRYGILIRDTNFARLIKKSRSTQKNKAMEERLVRLAPSHPHLIQAGPSDVF